MVEKLKLNKRIQKKLKARKGSRSYKTFKTRVIIVDDMWYLLIPKEKSVVGYFAMYNGIKIS
jgi:hypothetical protein